MIRIYPKHQLLAAWEQQRERYAHDMDQPSLCLRCGSPLDKALAHNALSRSLDVYVCSKCGLDEAMRDHSGRALPLREWYAVREDRRNRLLAMALLDLPARWSMLARIMMVGDGGPHGIRCRKNRLRRKNP